MDYIYNCIYCNQEWETDIQDYDDENGKYSHSHICCMCDSDISWACRELIQNGQTKTTVLKYVIVRLWNKFLYKISIRTNIW